MKLEQDTVLQQLSKVYECALSVENFTAAIKAIEVCIKLLGVDKVASLKPDLQLASLSDRDLDQLIKNIDTQLGGNHV